LGFKTNAILVNCQIRTIITEVGLAVVVGYANVMKFLGVPSYVPGSETKSRDIIADLPIYLLRNLGAFRPSTALVRVSTSRWSSHFYTCV
jgi:hypothetical protein